MINVKFWLRQRLAVVAPIDRVTIDLRMFDYLQKLKKQLVSTHTQQANIELFALATLDILRANEKTLKEEYNEILVDIVSCALVFDLIDKNKRNTFTLIEPGETKC